MIIADKPKTIKRIYVRIKSFVIITATLNPAIINSITQNLIVFLSNIFISLFKIAISTNKPKGAKYIIINILLYETNGIPIIATFDNIA